MNRLVIIGNGFDLAHGLKTSYADFINWYWEQRLDSLLTESTQESKDCLCTLRIKDSNWFNFFLESPCRDKIKNEWKYTPSDIIHGIKENEKDFSITCCPFFEAILMNLEEKGWVDIENEYYRLLKDNVKVNLSCKELNKQLQFLKEQLIEYLKTQKSKRTIYAYNSYIMDPVLFDEIGTKEVKRIMDEEFPKERFIPKEIMLLNFNYTPTTNYYQSDNTEINHIHGSLDNPETVIFGYGDELDKDYKELQEANDNELLTNVKSIRYLEMPNYRNLLRFIESAPFQVHIMGHSCGLSDRTLLNTIFEHENCVSIKPFFYEKSDGSDNYTELVQNISRNFTDMKLFRSRVVNKTRCKRM